MGETSLKGVIIDAAPHVVRVGGPDCLCGYILIVGQVFIVVFLDLRACRCARDSAVSFDERC
ncbi:hypothetical protein M413DRAFT_448586, partial [Hebeloma cylindrosporum]